jgi:hypothetical protein
VIAAPDTGMVAAATAQAAARYSVTEMRRGIRTILETVASGGRP